MLKQIDTFFFQKAVCPFYFHYILELFKNHNPFRISYFTSNNWSINIIIIIERPVLKSTIIW